MSNKIEYTVTFYPAAERPDEEGTYLCRFNDGAVESYDYDADEDLEYWGTGRYEVTHWAELPEFTNELD